MFMMMMMMMRPAMYYTFGESFRVYGNAWGADGAARKWTGDEGFFRYELCG